MKYLIALLLVFPIESLFAQQNKLTCELGLGLGTGWWVQESDYEIQNEIITDWANSRLSLDIPISASIKYQLGKYVYIGPGFAYSSLIAKNLYASSASVPSFTKTKIAETSVKTVRYYFSIETPAIQNSKYTLSPQFNIGTFQIESLHPDEKYFTEKLLLEAVLQFSFNPKNRLIPFIEMYYSNLSFRSNTPLVYKRINHIQSIGTKLGIRF